MAALTQERLAEFSGTVPTRRTLPMKAAAKIFKGSMVGLDSSGNALAAGLTAGGTVRTSGVAMATTDNTAGGAGAIKVEAQLGIYKMNNAAADLVTNASVGALCYVVDDNSVGLTNGTSTRAPAGIVHAVDADGVDVLFQ